MKKVLSVVLALVMVLATMIMLIPTTSAAGQPGTNVAPLLGAGGKVYYEENFDDPALQGLEDDALAEAIGWAQPGDTNTMLMDSDALRIVSQYTPDGVYPAEENSWAGGYDSAVVVDEDLIKNAIVIEYKFTYNRREAIPENDLTVTKKDGTEKTIKADGQGLYQFAAFHYSGARGNNFEIMVPRINMDGSKLNTFKAYNAIGGSTVAWKDSAISIYNPIGGGTTYTDIEYNNNPSGDSKIGTYISNIMDHEYSVKTIIDPVGHYMYAYVDDTLFTSVNLPGGWGDDTQSYDVQALFTDTLKFWAKPGMDVTLDDIKISEYVPHLTISEVMVNGTKANGTGKYQWLELTNPTDAPVNVYDYGIHLYNAPDTGVSGKRTLSIGGEADTECGTANYYKDAGSTLGYFTPGAKTLDSGEVFDSPAYADGVLQPGESAIVLFPQTAIAGETSVTDEAFNAYLTGLGMPAGTKTFVCDNKSDYNFSLGCLTNEAAIVQVVKVTNNDSEGGYDPVADCAGQWTCLAPAFAECTALISSKANTSGSNYYGLVVNKFPGRVSGGALFGLNFAATDDRSAEITYSNVFQTGANVRWGFTGLQYTEANTATPGFVPAVYRRSIDIDVVDVTGTVSKVLGAHLTDTVVTLDTPQRKGSDVQIWVDGEMVVADVDTTTYELTIPAAEMTNDWHTVEVKYYDAEPLIIGFQQSELAADGTYTIRVLAGVNNAFAYESVGFKLYIDLTGDGSEYREADVECKFIYDSVTVAGETVSAKTYGVESLYAIHINGVPVDDYSGAMVISATATYTPVGGTATAARQGAMNFTPAVTPATPAE